MTSRTKEILASPQFRRFVSRRWLVSLLLTLALFVSYYGFVLLVALNREFMAQRVGESITLGILFGIGVILASFALTAIYVVWANRYHDSEATELRRLLRD